MFKILYISYNCSVTMQKNYLHAFQKVLFNKQSVSSILNEL